MLRRLRRYPRRAYERLLEREVTGAPTHVAVIQDGNRRYADARGADTTEGHRAGADTTSVPAFAICLSATATLKSVCGTTTGRR